MNYYYYSHFTSHHSTKLFIKHHSQIQQIHLKSRDPLQMISYKHNLQGYYYSTQQPTRLSYFSYSTNIQQQLQMDTEINPPDGYFAPSFTWDAKRTSAKLTLDQQNLTCTVKQGTGFKSTLGSMVFTAGDKYYFEVFLNKGQLIKIGVCRPEVNIDEAFSDTLKGWGIYNGQLRHNSNSTGPKYGQALNTGDLIGIAVDMVKGTLSYYKNNVCWGIAFKDEELMKGQLVAAVAPIYQYDQFTLKGQLKED